MNRLFPLAAVSLFSLQACIVVEPGTPAAGGGQVPGKDKGKVTQLPVSAPSYGQPLTAQTGPGSVTIREGARVLTSFRTALPNVEQTRWYAEQEQIVVKSRGNHGPATIELFNSRSGARLGSVKAFEAANGPAWARSMAE